MITKLRRKIYVCGMMRAINAARKSMFIDKTSKSDGLLAIKRFEEVNDIKFDPFDKRHTEKILGCAPWERFFRSLRWKRVHDLNVRPSTYEADEIPGFSNPLKKRPRERGQPLALEQSSNECIRITN